MTLYALEIPLVFHKSLDGSHREGGSTVFSGAQVVRS